MINKPNKKTILAGYLAQALNIGYGVLLLPFMLVYLTEAEVAYWLIILALIGLTSVFDFGFSPTITRSVSYAFSGAKEIKKFGFETVGGGEVQPNWQLYAELIFAVKKIYKVIALIALLLLGISGSFYISIFLEKSQVESGYIVWLLFLVGFVINLYFLYFNPLLMGAGKVYETNLINVVIRMTWLGLSALGLVLYESIIVLPIAYITGILVGRIYAMYEFNRLTQEKLDSSIGGKEKTGVDIRTLFPNSWRMGVVTLGGFLINKASIFIAGLYLSVGETASYALTIQVLTVLIAFPQVYFNSHVPLFSKMRLRPEEKIKLKNTYYKVLFKSLTIYLLLGLLALILGDWILNMIHSNVFLIPTYLFILVLLFGFLELNHTLAATMITTGNHVPFVVPAILSGLGIVLVSIILIPFSQNVLLVLILVQGLIQLLYNNWKWPLMVYQQMKG